MPQRKGDPEFWIRQPVTDQILGPDFSVYGDCGPGMTGIVAHVGNLQRAATVSSGGYCWEAIFTAADNLSGPYEIYATCNGGGRTPVAPNFVSVTVDASPGITIEEPVPIGPMAAASDDNPWSRWQVGGTCDAAKFSEVGLEITQNGGVVWGGGGPGVPVSGTAQLNNGRWTCNLGFVPAGYRGRGFTIHYYATLKGTNNKKVCGSTRVSFNGPS